MASIVFVANVMADPATIRWHVDPAPGAVEVAGIERDALRAIERDLRVTRDGSELFAVFAEPDPGVASSTTTMPSIAGAWRVEDDCLQFNPRFPWVHGVRYRAEYRPAAGKPVVSFFELTLEKPGRATEVSRIFPTAGALPENQLKFYVHFSAPMSRGGTYEHVHIRDAQGGVIDLPFLELDEELWDPAMTRLTLLIDPGRIKRGVKPLEDIGPVFEAGKLYSLTVEAACRDAKGRPLRAAFEKKFRIVAADRTPPDPKQWKITAPKHETREPVSVEFNEPMDHALALRLIGVVSVSNAKVAVRGETALAQDERIWTLTPAEPWKRGAYCLTVATTIEDLAGNNIGKTFDVELVVGAQRRVTAASVSVPFEVK